MRPNPKLARSTPEPLLTPQEAADRLGVPVGAIYEARAAGHLSVVTISRRCIRIRPTDLEQYRAIHARKSGRGGHLTRPVQYRVSTETRSR